MSWVTTVLMLVGFLLFWIGFIAWNYHKEKKIVLAGHCGHPWKVFAKTHERGMGLRCRECETQIWVRVYMKVPRVKRRGENK